jgi:hypothetical protein
MQGLATLFVLGIIFWGFIVSVKEENKLIQDYSNKSGNDYYKNQNNKGILGEFLLFKNLQKLLFEKEFLLNLYLPRSDDFNKNTEIDLLMICEKGKMTYYSPKEVLRLYLPSLTLNVLIENDCYCIYKVI